MTEMNKRRKILLGILGTIVVVCTAVMAVYPEATRVVFYNLFAGSVKLDTSKEWTGGASYESIPYSDVSKSDYLNLYVPESKEPAPLLILVHGGGFVYNDCESRQAQLMYRYFRDRGFACASINYRLAQEAGFPAALEDVKSAVRFLRANAEKYGYRADNFTIWGESAGGYLAVMAGVTNDEEFNSLSFIGGKELEKPVSAKVSTILNYYGCMELQPVEERRAEYRSLGIPDLVTTLSAKWLTDAVKNLSDFDTVEDYWIGKNLTDLSEEEMQVFRPEYYIRKNLSPASPVNVLIWHGDADLDVPYTQSERIYDAFVEAEGEDYVDLTIFHNMKHAGDKLYSDENLQKIENYLNHNL